MRLPDAVADHVGGRHLVAVQDGQSGATVFRTDDAGPGLYLKIGNGAAAALVADEVARLRWLAGRAPAARVVAAGQDAASAWLLTQVLPGTPAGAWIKCDRGREDNWVERCV